MNINITNQVVSVGDNTIGYYIDNQEAVINDLQLQKKKLSDLMFSCNDREYNMIRIRIKQIENSIRFQRTFLSTQKMLQ